MMTRHWVCSTMLVLATSACKDESAAEATAPATDTPAPPVIAASDPERRPAEIDPKTESDDEGVGLFFKRRVVPTTPAREGGLLGLTRELVDTARRADGEPVRLVPDEAHFVMQARPTVLLAHPEGQAVWSKAEQSQASFKTAMDVVRACVGRLEAVEEVVLGFDDAEHLVLAARAKHLGTDTTWRCLQTETLARGQAFDLTVTGTSRGEGPQLRDDKGNLGYFPNDDTVVLVSKEWDASVQARLRGEGTAATEASLAGMMARIQPEDPLWVVGRITGEAERGLAGSPIAGIDDVTFDLRISGGDLVLALSADAGEAADAKRMRDAIQEQFDQMKTMLPMLGVPSSVASKLAFVAEGELLELDVTLTTDELRSIREGIERTF